MPDKFSNPAKPPQHRFKARIAKLDSKLDLKQTSIKHYLTYNANDCFNQGFNRDTQLPVQANSIEKQSNKQSGTQSSSSSTIVRSDVETNAFFDKLMMIYKKKKDGHKHEFSDEIKRFAMCIYITGGRSNYLQYMKHLPLPKKSTLYRFYSNQLETISEGVVRVKDLALFIERAKLSRYVWISEDATAITSRVEYDSKSRRIIGNMYPDDPVTGMPILAQTVVSSAKDIKQLAQETQLATDLNVFMCTSLSLNSAPFCLLAYGVGKSLNAESYIARVQHITKALAEYGIINVGCSADGAPGNSRGMKIQSNLGHKPDNSIPEEYVPYFMSKSLQPPFSVQDTIHLGGKLKNRFLDLGKVHRIGKYYFVQAYLAPQTR